MLSEQYYLLCSIFWVASHTMAHLRDDTLVSVVFRSVPPVYKLVLISCHSQIEP